WNFLLPVPIAIVALILLQVTLHLPRLARDKTIDYLGAVLITLGVGAMVVWISLGGHEEAGGFAWDSAVSIALGIAASALCVGAVLWEILSAKASIIPFRMFRQRTFILSLVAGVSVGF